MSAKDAPVARSFTWPKPLSGQPGVQYLACKTHDWWVTDRNDCCPCQCQACADATGGVCKKHYDPGCDGENREY